MAERVWGICLLYCGNQKTEFELKMGMGCDPQVLPTVTPSLPFSTFPGFKSYQKAVLSRDPQFRHLRAKLQYLMSSCYDFFLHTIASALFCGRVIDKYNPPLFTGCIDIFWYKHIL